LTLPAASSLAFPLTFTVVKPPAGDAFDVFFLSPAPAAGSASIRVERCENLRGARAHLDTDRGRITFALAPESAPLAVRNFVRLAEAGFYDGVAFHRIVKGLCVQAGDPASKTGDVSTLPGTGGNTFNGQPLPLERSPALFEKGTVGLTRVPDHLYQNVRSALAQYYQVSTDEALDEKLRAEWPSAHQLQEGVKSLTSGTSQFFICTSSIPLFTGRYAAFAKVVAGMEVVEALESSEVLGAKASNPVLAERPVLPPRLFKITIERPSSAAVKTK
jgi:peptidyl-prolyl cis-trans isomerase B (cyclophilin B)